MRRAADDSRQITECQIPKLPYLAAHADAEERLAKGERQLFCRTCARWKWEGCPIAVLKKRP